MASSIETTSTTTTLKNNGNTYLSVDTNDVVALTNPLPVASGGSVIKQIVNTQTGAVATGSTTIPDDDTIPQNDEGTEFMTLAITPTSATSKLRIDVTVEGSLATAQRIAYCLFQDSTAGALAVVSTFQKGNAQNAPALTWSHTMTAGTTSETTFKVRVGGAAYVFTFNGTSGGRKYGGVAASSITITEYTA
jgi:hypothetical protein